MTNTQNRREKILEDTFNFIKDYIEKNEISPTYREMGKAFNVTYETCFQRVKRLAARGRVKYSKHKDRNLIIVEQEKEFLK